MAHDDAAGPSSATGGAGALALRGVHHVSFRVDDLDAALRFYEELLGCERLPRPDFGFPGAWLQAGSQQIHLMEIAVDDSTGMPPPRINPMTNHVAFAVDDLDAVRDYVETNGLDVLVLDPASPQFWIQDPSGNVLEFTSTAP